MTRRAFVSFVDKNYLDGFMVLMSSVILHNAGVGCDFVVLHEDLDWADKQRIANRYNRVEFRKIETSAYDKFKKGLSTNYLAQKAYYILEAFKLEDYDTIICLDTDMVVLDDISELFELEPGFSACPQFYNSQDGKNLNSGLLVIKKPVLSGRTWNDLCDIGISGEYELDKHDQGILSAYFDGNYNKLHHDYNTVKRRLKGKEVPKTTKILHFTGQLKPWVDAETGYRKLQSVWEKYDLSDGAYFTKLISTAVRGRNYELAIFGAEQYRALLGNSATILMLAFPAYRALDRLDEVLPMLESNPLNRGHSDYGRYLRYLGEAYGALGGAGAGKSALMLAASAEMGQPVENLLAQLYWIENRLDMADAASAIALNRNPASRPNRMIKRRVALARQLNQEARKAESGAAVVSHAAFYMTWRGNAGDVLLPPSVRAAISGPESDVSWAPVHVHQRATESTVDRINATRGLVIGGGGLFISDTASNKESGWQWNISRHQLRRIKVPISVFAVGYNQFFGQGELSGVFSEHVSELLEKAHFFGLRNSGSMEALKAYVPAGLHGKIAYQPCPTTVLQKTHSEHFGRNNRKNYIALNIAFDRPNLRFQENYHEFLSEMADFIRGIRDDAEVRYFAHAVVDEKFLIDLAKYHDIALNATRLYDLDEVEVVRLYQEPRIVIGMRGHAGMIPFGCGTPIISLVTHPKLRYFLDDVNMLECAIEVDGSFAEELLAQTRKMLGSHPIYTDKVATEMERLWDITKQNVAHVRGGLALD